MQRQSTGKPNQYLVVAAVFSYLAQELQFLTAKKRKSFSFRIALTQVAQ